MYIKKATSQGLVNGYPNGAFGGEDSVTREQLVTMLWRYAGSPSAGTATFADADRIGTYAASAVAWAQSNGVVNGVGQNRFDPQGIVSRAQLATVLMNQLNRQSHLEKTDLPAYAEGPLSIAKQGLFSSGGTVTEPVAGTYDPTVIWMDATRAGNTAHVDHANVLY